MKKSIVFVLITTTLFAGQAAATSEPDKASTGKVMVWEGGQVSAKDVGAGIAVASASGAGAALGELITSKLSLADFVKANDLETAHWKDVTWRSGSDTLSIAGTELSKRTGVSSFKKIKMAGAPKVDKYYAVGSYYLPSGASVNVSSKAGVKVETKTETYGRNDQNTRTYYRCSYINPQTSKSGDKFTVSSKSTIFRSYSTSRCGTDKSMELTVTITTPVPDSQPHVNYFLRVNE